jgi:DNA-binding IclR family transcriptional regulator
MSVAYTSYRSYNEITKDLPERQLAVFNVLSNNPDGMTNKEIARTLMMDANEVIPRLDELSRKGFVTRCQSRYCRITGRLAILWKAITTDAQQRMF